MKKIVIIGAGAMGSAFAVPCADNGNETILVGSFIEDKIIEQINNNNNFHPVLNCQLPKNIKVIKYSELNDQIKKNIDLLVVGVSSKGIEWIGNEFSKFYESRSDILLLTKGLAVIDNKFETLAEKLEKILIKNGIKNPKISAVGGPCLATGLANRINSSVVLANKDMNVIKNIGSIISTNYYSTEYSTDLIGIEICAATKNIYSMLIGASEGLSNSKATKEVQSKYFLNTAASLIHRSVSEMVEFVSHYGGKPETVYGLAGLGDLYVSAIGGRNSLMGKYLGQGYLYSEAKEKFMKNITVEGAELALEIGPRILEDLNGKNFPLMFSMLNTICENKKLEINW